MPTTIDRTEAEKFLSMLFEPGDCIEIRGLKVSRGRSHSEHTKAGEALTSSSRLAWIERHNIPGWGLFVGVNPRKPGAMSGGARSCTDADVECARCLFADIDGTGEIDALERVQSVGLPEPTLVVGSGGGVHLYWRLDIPFEDLEEWSGYQRALAAVLGGDRVVVNPSRIMRLPGTMNFKRERPVPVRILGTGGVVSLSSLPISPIERMTHPSEDLFRSDDRPGWGGLSRATYQFLARGAAEGERNARLFAAAADMAGCGIGYEEAAEALRAPAVRSGLTGPEAQRTVSSAFSRPRSPSNPVQYGIDLDSPGALVEAIRAINRERRTPPEYTTPAGQDSTGRPPLALDEARNLGNPVRGREAPTEAPATAEGSEGDSDGDEATAGIVEAQRALYAEPEAEPEFDPAAMPYTDRVETVGVISNVAASITIDQGQRREVLSYKRVEQIAAEIREATGGWPMLSDGLGLFGMRGTTEAPEVWLLSTADDLFAFLHDRAAVSWHSGQCEDPVTGARRSAVTRAEIFTWLKANCLPRVEAVYSLPHAPKLPRSFYIPKPIRPSVRSGHLLGDLVESFNAESDIDRTLLLAALLTPGWGGKPGSRPAMVLTSEHGQSSGKTATARIIGDVWGGAAMLDYSPDWATVTKRIFSSDDWDSRVMLFDNIKGKNFGGTGIETAVTAKTISGHRMYHGTISRPNIATWFVTFNLPSFSRDMAERSVEIRIGSPKSGSWLEWADSFVSRNREGIVAEIMAILSGPTAVETVGRDRWSAWHSQVLGRIPRGMFAGVAGGNEASAAIIDRRSGIDADSEIREDLLSTLAGYLWDTDRREGTVFLSVIEAVRVIQEAGLWSPRIEWAERIVYREGARWIEEQLLGSGPVFRRDTSGKRLSIDGRGVPTPAKVQGRSRSRVYLWCWETQTGHRLASELGGMLPGLGRSAPPAGA